MKDAKNDNFVFLRVELVHDDVGEAGDRPFKCAWSGSDMTYFGKVTKAIAISKNPIDDMRGCAGVLCLNVKVDRGDVIKRFEREAQLHIRARFLARSTS
jgi:hypothetical protein